MKHLIILFLLFISLHLKAQDAISTDTIRIYRSDTAFIIKLGGLTHRPCQKPRFVTSYRMKPFAPDSYYIISDRQNKIQKEGYYISGVSYNEVSYNYNKSGRLTAKTFMEEGRHVRAEIFDRKGRIKEINYRDKKNGDIFKVEFYTNGKLKKVRNYYGFNSYHTEHY